MLSRKIPKLRLWSRLGLRSKGSSNAKQHSISNSNHHNITTTSSRKTFSIRSREFGKYALQGIPVLSIFALVGMIAYGIGLYNLATETGRKSYAVGTSGDVNNSTSLIIDNGNIKDTINATTGETTYVSHSVQVKANDIESYSLTITGPTNLTGTTTISGAGGKTGSAMADNTWGYGWGAANTTDVSTLTYQSFNGNAQSLPGDAIDTSTNGIDFTRTLAFAARFGNNADPGHYTANVNLNLVAEPKKIVGLDSISLMQEITPEICDATSSGDKQYTLEDARTSDSSYTVAKLADNRCWMTSNLVLELNNKTLTPADSDVIVDWVSTTGESKLWENDANICRPAVPSGCYVAKYYNGSTDANWKKDYGYYYTWTAVTAGTGVLATQDEATSSICPKGWTLPSKAEYDELLSSAGVMSNAVGSNTLRQAPFNFTYSGIINWDKIYNTEVAGFAWTKTAGTSKSYAWYLSLGAAEAKTADSTALRGIPARCIAKNIQ